MRTPLLIMNMDFFDWVSSHHGHRGVVPTEQAFRDFVQLCADKGFDTMFFRTSVAGRVCYPSQVMTPFGREYRLDSNYLRDVMDQWNPLEVAIDACRKSGLNVYAWVSLFDSYCPGLEDHFFADHPELLMRSRDDKQAMRGVPCYACEGTREYRLREARELAEYGADGVFYSVHSHTFCGSFESDPREENAFGFNREAVDEYQNRHGVNIIEQDFDPLLLARVHGDALTDYLRLARDELNRHDQGMLMTYRWRNDGGEHGHGETMTWLGYARDRAGYPYLHQVGVHLDCETWVRDNLVDGLFAQADYVDEVEQIRARTGGGRFYLWVYCGFDQTTVRRRRPTIERMIEDVYNSPLTGLTFHEELSFEYCCPELWDLIADNAPRFRTAKGE
jgi:hypothetical protein